MFRNENNEKSKGQSLVELALIMPVAIMILVLSADFGRAMTAYIQVGSAAREGAAFGMQSESAASDQAGIEAAVLAESSSIWGVEPEVSSQVRTDGMFGPAPSNVPYQLVEVQVSYNFQPLITIWPMPNSIPMQRTVEMRVVN